MSDIPAAHNSTSNYIKNLDNLEDKNPGECIDTVLCYNSALSELYAKNKTVRMTVDMWAWTGDEHNYEDLINKVMLSLARVNKDIKQRWRDHVMNSPVPVRLYSSEQS